MQITKINKLIVAAIGLAAIVFEIDNDTTQKLVAAATALAVYLVPNSRTEVFVEDHVSPPDDDGLTTEGHDVDDEGNEEGRRKPTL